MKTLRRITDWLDDRQLAFLLAPLLPFLWWYQRRNTQRVLAKLDRVAELVQWTMLLMENRSCIPR